MIRESCVVVVVGMNIWITAGSSPVALQRMKDPYRQLGTPDIHEVAIPCHISCTNEQRVGYAAML